MANFNAKLCAVNDVSNAVINMCYACYSTSFLEVNGQMGKLCFFVDYGSVVVS
jgi:hypothetical protein